MKDTTVKTESELCPYCSQRVVIVHSSEIYGAGHDYGLMKKCSNFPRCDSYSGMGASLANQKLRELRKECHLRFDERWKSGKANRGNSYLWLQKVMGLSAKQAHISLFRDKECNKLLKILTNPH